MVVLDRWRLGGYEAGRSQRREAGYPRIGLWALVEPSYDPIDIHGGGGGHVLYVRLWQPPIPRAPQPKGAHALREGPFDAGSPFVVCFKTLGVLALARVLSQFFFEAICGMISRCEQRYVMRESDDGDQFQGSSQAPSC